MKDVSCLPIPSAWRRGDFAIVDVGSIGTQLALVEDGACARPKIQKWSSKHQRFLAPSHIQLARLIGRPMPDDPRLLSAAMALNFVPGAVIYVPEHVGVVDVVEEGK